VCLHIKLNYTNNLTSASSASLRAADLKGEELGWGLRHTLSEDLANDFPHPLERKTLLRGNLGDRNAPIEEADDALLTLDLFQAGGSSYPG
jgi:hypothetical protein